jgi:hypothetical protein
MFAFISPDGWRRWRRPVIREQADPNDFLLRPQLLCRNQALHELRAVFFVLTSPNPQHQKCAESSLTVSLRGVGKR